MKKFISVLLSALMACAISVPSFAEAPKAPNPSDTESVVAYLTAEDGTIKPVETECKITKVSDNVPGARSAQSAEDGLYKIEFKTDELHIGKTVQSGADAYIDGTIWYVKQAPYTVLREFEITFHEGQDTQVWNKWYQYGSTSDRDKVKVSDYKGSYVHKYLTFCSESFHGIRLKAGCQVEGFGVRESLTLKIDSK